MAIYNILQIFSVSVWLTIFYKRDFEFGRYWSCRKGYLIALIFAWGLVYATDSLELTVVISFGTLVYVCKEVQTLVLAEIIKFLVLGVSLIFTRIFPAEYLAYGAALCALSQLLRWPIRLKTALREFRIIFGPVYTICTTGSCIQADFTSTLLIIATILALVASILLRPDNSEVLKVLNKFGLPIPTQQCRKLVHGLFMFISFILCMIYIIAHSQVGAIDSRFFYVICVIAIVNICMYTFVADLPRTIVRILSGIVPN